MATSRLEDRRLVSGQGKYSADYSPAGLLHAVFLRADRAHADIVAVDTTAACAIAGVHLVLTGEDCVTAGYGSLPCVLPFKGRGGQELRKPFHPVLAQSRVRYVGEPLACIVAESVEAALDAAEAIVVTWRDLAVVVDPSAALAQGATSIHAAVPGNLAFDYDVGDEAAVEAAFVRAAHLVDLEVDNQRLVANPMEPRACVAIHHAADDSYTLHCCTQGVAGMRGQIAGVVGVPAERIRIDVLDVGGGFGVRYNAYPETCALLLAAKRVARPVKWVATRSEVFLCDEHGRAARTRCRLALDAELRFIAMRFDFVCDLGAYAATTGPFINTRNTTDSMSGVYRVPAIFGNFKLAYTNTVPVAAYRGAGRPLMSYAIERLVDEAAVQLGVDPIELRRRNLIPRDAFPYRTPQAGVYDCGDFHAVLDMALRAGDIGGFAARRTHTERSGRLRGLGIATFLEVSSPGAMPDQVELRFRPDGGVAMHVVSHSQGQGHATSFARIVGGVLGLPHDSIELRQGDAAVFLSGNATGGSRSLIGVGSVLMLAAEEVVRKGRDLAAVALEVERADVEFSSGEFRARGRRLSLATLAQRYGQAEPHPLDVRMEGFYRATCPNGCHIAEVEIDPMTGDTRLASYLAVDDAGTIVDHSIVEGQVIGGLAQGVGQVLGEHARFDADSGQLLTGSFMDYPMPRAGILPLATRALEFPLPTATNPLGAKGVGESPVTGSLPAVMNAILDALRRVGVTAFDMPATPARVWAAIEAARSANMARR